MSDVGIAVAPHYNVRPALFMFVGAPTPWSIFQLQKNGLGEMQ